MLILIIVKNNAADEKGVFMKKNLSIKYGAFFVLLSSYACIQAQQVTVSPTTARAIQTGQAIGRQAFTAKQKAMAMSQSAKEKLSSFSDRLSKIGGRVAEKVKPVATKVATKVAVKTKQIATKVASKVGDVVEASVTASIEQLAERVALATVDATSGFAASVAAGENVLESARKSAEGLAGEIKGGTDEALRTALVTAANETQEAFILGVQRGAELVAQKLAAKQLEQEIETLAQEDIPGLDEAIQQEIEAELSAAA